MHFGDMCIKLRRILRNCGTVLYGATSWPCRSAGLEMGVDCWISARVNTMKHVLLTH